jgi:hypothetical protein
MGRPQSCASQARSFQHESSNQTSYLGQSLKYLYSWETEFRFSGDHGHSRSHSKSHPLSQNVQKAFLCEQAHPAANTEMSGLDCSVVKNIREELDLPSQGFGQSTPGKADLLQ